MESIILLKPLLSLILPTQVMQFFVNVPQELKMCSLFLMFPRTSYLLQFVLVSF